MIESFRERVIIRPGGFIEIQNSALKEGTSAEVIVMIDTAEPDQNQPPLSSYLGKGKGVYGSAEEADRILTSERDAWES